MVALSLSSAAWAEFPSPRGPCVVVVSSESTADAASLMELRAIAKEKIRQQGQQVLDDGALAAPQEVGTASAAAQRLGASEVYVVRVGRLGERVSYSLERRDRATAILASATLQGTLEEGDVILGRLAEAAVRGVSVENTVRYATVTSDEGRVVQKQSGERLFALGLPLGLAQGAKGTIGLSLSYMYEAEKFRVGGTALLAGGDGGVVGLLGLDGAYLFSTGAYTPFLGGGVGYMGSSTTNAAGNSSGGNGLGLTAEAGVELLRLSRARVLLSAEVLIPLYMNTQTVYSPDFSSSSVLQTWSPNLLLNARVAF